jgi:hypothetical protein
MARKTKGGAPTMVEGAGMATLTLRGPSPVIAGRVPTSLHRQIKKAAEQSGRSMSEELAWRAALSFEWEKQFGDTQKLLTDARRAIESDLRQAMIAAGYTPIRADFDTFWAEPGHPISEAFKKAIAKAKGGGRDE